MCSFVGAAAWVEHKNGVNPLVAAAQKLSILPDPNAPARPQANTLEVSEDGEVTGVVAGEMDPAAEALGGAMAPGSFEALTKMFTAGPGPR